MRQWGMRDGSLTMAHPPRQGVPMPPVHVPEVLVLDWSHPQQHHSHWGRGAMACHTTCWCWALTL
jgi:hypothetical protein